MMPAHPDVPDSASQALVHPFTPATFLDTMNTLGCYQVAGLRADQAPAWRGNDLARFQAERLLEAGYVLLWHPTYAAALLQSGREHGHTDGPALAGPTARG